MNETYLQILDIIFPICIGIYATLKELSEVDRMC